MRIATSLLTGVASLLLVTAVFATAPTPTNVLNEVDKVSQINSETPDPIYIDVGGDTIGSATVIPGLPYTDSGNTCAYVNNYDAVCPFTGSTAADVVYRFNPTVDILVDIDLCTSLYDTKVYVFDGVVNNTIACNDDACGSDGWKSLIECLQLYAGHTYYIVVDGYGTGCGTYYLTVSQCLPCVIECPPGAIAEGEPDCGPNYYDATNGGCNSSPPVFTILPCGDTVTVCGTYGGFLYGSSSYRDTDWYQITLTQTTTISWCVAGEYDTLLGMIDGRNGCPVTTFYAYTTTPDCTPACVTQTLPPGVWWMFVAPLGFGPSIGCGLDYVATLTGYVCPPIPVEATSWGDIKALYK